MSRSTNPNSEIDLSKQALELLLDNGYYCTINDELIEFKPSKASAIILMIILSIIMVFCAIPMIGSFMVGFVTMLLPIPFFIRPIRRRLRKPSIKINTKKRVISNESGSISFSLISKLHLESQFISEYSSPFKQTSQEYEVTIQAQNRKGQSFTLIAFQSDYENPNKTIKEIAFYIHSRIKNASKKA